MPDCWAIIIWVHLYLGPGKSQGPLNIDLLRGDCPTAADVFCHEGRGWELVGVETSHFNSKEAPQTQCARAQMKLIIGKYANKGDVGICEVKAVV